jgi:Zn-finger nucleic acid-binding protein
MNAETRKCPMCGASTSTDATRCEHCGSRLATISCPTCFGMMFLGAKYCSHCGAPARRIELEGGQDRPCPRCTTPLSAVMVGQSQLLECSACEGIWADTETLTEICRSQDQQAAILGRASVVEPGESGPIEKVRYVPCPVCRNLMHRVQFANCSRVIIDVCKQHGTWFDRDELRRIVEFTRSGGLEEARRKEKAQLEAERRQMKAERVARAFASPQPGSEYTDSHLAVSAASALLRAILD